MRNAFRVTADMRSENRVTAARAYLEAGLPLVITHGINEDGVCTCGKKSCRSPGKHPISEFFPSGVKSATTDFSVIRKALKSIRCANIAATLAGRTVVDIDGPEGEKAVKALGLPRTATVRTGRGKHHHFVGALDEGTFKAVEVDVLSGDNRYVMLPPSHHQSGIRYKWIARPNREAAEVPEALTELKRASGAQRRPRRRSRPRGKIQEGQRNDVLFRMACAARRWFKDDHAVLEIARAANLNGCESPISDAELRSVIASSGRYGESREELFGPPVQREPLPMEWLWYPYIPRYGLTIMAGDPGAGKSLLTALLTATVTKREPLPMTDEVPTGNRALLLAAEDNWARVTLRRLTKAGVDLNNLHQMYKYRPLTDERLERLAGEIEQWQPDLVIIDTLSAYMGGGRDMHRQNEVGEFLARLTEMAEDNGSAIVGIAHLNKQSSENPLYRIVGSIGFAASIRSALFFGPDPADPSRVAMAHGKSNQSELGKTIIFEKLGGGRDDVPVLRPLGYSDVGHQDVCRVVKQPVGRPGSEREAAINFILGHLTDQPASWSSVAKIAKARSIASDGTLNQVRAELAKSRKILQVGKGKQAKWTLGDAVSPSSEDESI